MKNAIIFDMDGTLFQTNSILEASLEDTFTMLRSKKIWKGNIPLQQYKEIMGVPLSVVWKTLLSNQHLDVHSQANEFFHEKLIENIKNGKGELYPNVKEILSYLYSREYLIFIASNGYPHYLNNIVEYFGLDEWIQKCYSIQEVDSTNKGDLIRKVKKENNLIYGTVVGDRLSDFKGAEVNDFLSIGCAFDFSDEEELKEADIVIDDLMGIKDFFEHFLK